MRIKIKINKLFLSLIENFKFKVFLDDTHQVVLECVDITQVSRHRSDPNSGLRCAVYIRRYRGTSIARPVSLLSHITYHWIISRWRIAWRNWGAKSGVRLSMSLGSAPSRNPFCDWGCIDPEILPIAATEMVVNPQWKQSLQESWIRILSDGHKMQSRKDVRSDTNDSASLPQVRH